MLCLHQDPEQHREARSEPASGDMVGRGVNSDLLWQKQGGWGTLGGGCSISPFRP